MVKDIMYNRNNQTYKVGKFCWQVDGASVIVTRDSGKSIESIAIYHYADNETAHDKAYAMAVRHTKA